MRKPAPRGVSIIVPAALTARDTLVRTRSLLRHSPSQREIIIVDGTLPPREVELLRRFEAVQPTVRFFHYDDTPTLGTMYNRAARKAARACVLFVLGDIRIDRAATFIIEKMMERAMRPEAGATGSLIVDKNRNVLHAGVYRPEDEPFGALYAGHPLGTVVRKLGTRTYPYDPRKSRPVMAVAGALMISRTKLRAVGGFSEAPNLEPAAAQVELCLRANRTGRQTWFVGGGHFVAKRLTNLQPPPDLLKKHGELADEWSPEAPAPRAPRAPLFRFRWPRKIRRG